MPDQNRVFVTGFITEQPELRTTALKGKSVCNPTIRINDRKKTPDGWQPYVEFVPVVAFGNLAEFISTLQKGTRVRIEGKLQANQFERDGVMVSELQVMAYELDILTRPNHGNHRQDRNREADTDNASNTAPNRGRNAGNAGGNTDGNVSDSQHEDDNEKQPDSNDNRSVDSLTSGGGWTPDQERRGPNDARRGRGVGYRRSRGTPSKEY